MSVVSELVELAHGYSMADVDRISRVAVKKHYRTNNLDYDDRSETAWHAIVEALYTSWQPPEFHELLKVALEALDKLLRDHLRHSGNLGDHPAPHAAKYWLPVKNSHNDGFTDRVVEVMALPNALSVLTPEQYDAIITLAAYDNAAADAAAALGLKYQGFMYRIYSAREKVRAVWFEDETPPQPKKAGETCRTGHSRAEHGKQLPDGRWQCRVCTRAAERRRRAARGVTTAA